MIKPRGTTVTIRGLEKTWASPDRRFTLMVDQFDLAPGEVLALTGASGSGKSTLLELVGLAARPDRVERLWIGGPDGHVDAAELFAGGRAEALAKLRARRMGFVLQNGGLLPFITVRENVALGQRLADRPDEARINVLLARLGIADLADAYPAQLSAGQRQRVAIGRAVAHGPALLLADEPTAALDPPNKARVIDIFLDLAAEAEAAVLIATHEREALAGRGLPEVRIETVMATGGDVRAELAWAA